MKYFAVIPGREQRQLHANPDPEMFIHLWIPGLHLRRLRRPRRIPE
jgi:hypothetical protein